MPVPTQLPYIDLGVDAEILRKYAQDNFGKKISTLAKDETVKDRFKAIYFEETGITLADVDTSFNDDDFDAGMVVEEVEEVKVKKEVKAKPVPVAVTIIIQDDPTDPGDVKGAANFVPYILMRNVEVKVSMSIFESLKTAVATKYNPDTMVPKDVLTYPFSVIEMHYE